MSIYVTVKCPRCMSASELKTTSAISGPFFCPVCTEGEIEGGTEQQHGNRHRNEIVFDWDQYKPGLEIGDVSNNFFTFRKEPQVHGLEIRLENLRYRWGGVSSM